MHYLGGKYRISKFIIPFLKGLRKKDQVFLEPFVGAGNIFAYMDGEKICSDIQEDLIMLLIALRDNTIDLPDTISEEEYQFYKTAPSSAIRAFVGYGCSFGGKWFGGYARCKTHYRNYCLNAKNSLLKRQKGFQNTSIYCKDYRNWEPNDYLIYCDPPYRGTTKIANIKFNSDEFWDIMRKWSQNNIVVISEYHAPEDFTCVLEMPTKTDMQTKNGGKEARIEKIFMLKSP